MTDIRPSISDENEDLRAREKKLPKVRTTSGTMVPFEATKIIDSLVLEAKLSRPDAHLVCTRVMDRIAASGIKFLSGPLIREMCNSVLAEFGLEKERVRYTRVGVPMYDLDLLISATGEHTNNANLMRNPETIAKLVHDQVMEQHTYLTIPPHLADAHLRGDIYIKDREYFSTRDYCATWDLRQVLKLGIAPDGLGGLHSSAAGPAQHLNVAVNHSAIWLAAAQSSFAGGQGYFYYNTFLAPYMRGLPYKKIKQAAQQLIFTLTQQYVARGGQVIFSSVDLTPGIPKIMKDVSAVLPGGKETETTYGDYEEEARLFFDAFMDIMIKGDSKGKGFNFPKPNVVLREEFMGPEYDESWRKVAELTAKFGSPYFENYMNWRSTIEAGCSSCCSHLWTASSDEELEEFLTGNMVFGASQMVTPNFGRAAYIGRADEDKFFAKVDEYVELSKEVILEKKRLMDKLIASGSVPFYTQPKPN
ncbi:MAG: anaerobic ribonucleoside-triphosphate reductase, partial [Candidatus Thorarchaeota archaeon]